MSTSKLKTLRIEHLRGSVIPFTLPFEAAKTLTVIYGENGTGKTTICDALEFLGKGKVGSLEDRGLGKTNRYWHSVGKAPADVTVILESSESSCTARIHKGDVVAIPTDARPRVEVLRRSQITTLVEARAGERYAAISRFLDVAGVESAETALRDLIRDLTGGRETAVARVQENEDSINQFWVAAGKPGTNPIMWAESESERDVSKLQEELGALEKLRAEFQRLSEFPEKLATTRAVLNSARSEAEACAKTLSELLSSVAEGAGEIVSILEAARPYLDEHPDLAACPLCESAEKANGLRERVEQRAKEFSALQVAKQAKLVADNAVTTASTRLEEQKLNCQKAVEAFQIASTGYQWGDDVQLPPGVTPDPDALAQWITSNGAFPDTWTQAESARRDQSQFFRTLKEALKTYKSNSHRQAELDVLLPRLQKSLDITMDERRRFTDAVLQSIATYVGELYEQVHPGEGLNKISLELDPNKRASLEIAAEFADQPGSPPQAYFSQSHLDTLGLCVFLALAARDDPQKTVLVLDDVLASVDEPHVERLIEMLYNEATKFRHCVITTHYRPWKQKLRWGWLQNGQCQFVELAKWTRADGLKVIRSVPDIDRLRILLAETPPDPQLVCAKAGVVLEAALDFLTQLYECSVPRRPNSLFTLGDLLPALGKKLRASLRLEILRGHDATGKPEYESVNLAPLLEEIGRIVQARNAFGCHFNELSFALLEADAIGFGQQVLYLLDLLTDSGVGWPRNAKSGSYWATAGETRRLHPLNNPS